MKNMLNFKKGCFSGKIDYVKVGKGEKKFIIFPGTEDLIWGMKKYAEIKSLRYSYIIPKDYTFYVLSYNRKITHNDNLEQVADDFAEIIKKEIGPGVILGFSFGGLVAIPFASRHPELSKKLILLSSAYDASKEGIDYAQKLLDFAKDDDYDNFFKKLSELFNRAWLKYLAYPALKTKRTIIPSEKNFEVFVNAYSMVLKDAGKKKHINHLKKIKCPTLVVGSDKDQFFSEKMYKETAKNIEKSELKIFKNESHTVALERMREIKRVIRKFLKSS